MSTQKNYDTFPKINAGSITKQKNNKKKQIKIGYKRQKHIYKNIRVRWSDARTT